MPWDTTQDLLRSVPALKVWPARYQEQFRAVANRCLREGGAEGACIARAWIAIKKQATRDGHKLPSTGD